MINGAHTILYSADADADRAFLRDVLGLPNVDAGRGWLIFGLPPSEIAVHPSDTSTANELYFMCENVERFVQQMGEHQIPCEEIDDQGWGRLTHITLPGGGRLGVYEPRHERPDNPTS